MIMNLQKYIEKISKDAQQASQALALMPTSEKNKALVLMAKALIANKDFLVKENKKDLTVAYKKKYPVALLDRLTLTEKRIRVMADSLLATARLKDPVGDVVKTIRRPNGLLIKKVRVPIGVVAIIYESRPNVTSDCIGLCLKSGNASILKGGKEAFYSNVAIFKVLQEVLSRTKISKNAIALVSSTDRAAVNILLKQDRYIDVVVPRGGEGLIRFVVENSFIPVVKHYKGVCHTFVSASADIEMARKICLNAKVQRPGVCNAMETLLVHQKIAKKFLPLVIRDLQKAGVEIRGCEKTHKICGSIKKATEKDWREEYLDLILAVKVVDDAKAAIDHINKYGTKHSDAIVTRDRHEAEAFLKGVDSACVYVNASTRFTDGYEFGFGAEIGISTDKLHARGPMALEELTTYKYLVFGKGQVRR